MRKQPAIAYVPPREPWPWQKEARDKMRGKAVFALLMAMRTGKTKTLLDDYGELEAMGLCVNLMVTAPGGAYETWLAAAHEELSSGLLSRMTIHIWRSGNGVGEKRRRRAFSEAKGPRLLIMNIEALSSVDDARELARAFLCSAISMLAIDESTTIKNHGARRSKFVIDKLGPLASFRRILSGLPTPRSPLDLYAQFAFLDWRIIGHRSEWTFKMRYAKMVRRQMGGRAFWQVVGYQNVEELQGLIEPYSYRKLLEDCYELPEKMYSIRPVEMTREQRRLYNELREFATTAIGGEDHITATIVIVQMLRLHQILCGHVVDELGVEHTVPENKTRELMDLLEEYDGKAIIWCSYDADIVKVHAAIEKEYGRGSCARFWGGNMREREGEEKRFKGDPSCRFMVATPAAGGKGRQWSVANLVVYYSSTNDLEHRSQSEERPQAVGKKDHVAYVDLIHKGTVEEKFLDALRGKINLAAMITGDSWREWVV